MKICKTIIALGLTFYGTNALAQCPFEVGQTISPMTVEAIRGYISQVPIQKDTFETSAQFEDRRLLSLQSIVESPVTSFTHVDDKFIDDESNTIRYDADEQRVLFTDYFFSNEFDPAQDILRSSGLIDRYSEAYISFNIHVQDTVLRTYLGGNALGASIEVTEIRRDFLSIAQLAPNRERSYHPIFQTEVVAEMPSVMGSGMEEEDVMTFDFPLEVAKEDFFDLRPVISFKLQSPFMLYGEDYIQPVARYPVERNFYANVLIGDILCGGIVNGNGLVLDVVNVATANKQ